MTTTLVSSVDELYSAIATAQDGEIIELAPGTYDRIAIWDGLGFDINFETPITIRSADPNDPAVVQQLELTGASGFVFDGLYFDYDAPVGAPYYVKHFEINSSSNITIANSIFDGDLAEGVGIADDGYGTGFGLSVRGSDNITVENNEFFNFYNALSFGGGEEYVIRGNDIHSIRSDGITVTKSQNVLIEDNYIHDFERSFESKDHADMIQFFTYGNTEPITDVLIRDNRLDIGEGDHTQGIFMGNEAVAVENGSTDMYYQRITIENNLIINSHSNGIVVGAADELVISNNTLLHSDGGSFRDDGHLELPTIRVARESTNVVIAENVAYTTPDDIGKTNWLVTNNALVQDLDPASDGYYAKAEDLLNGTVWEEGNAVDLLLPESDFVETPQETPVVVNDLDPNYDLTEGYNADFAALLKGNAKAVKDGASYDDVTNSFVFNGEAGAVILGKLNEYRDTDQLTVSTLLTVDDLLEDGQIFNNHIRLSAEIKNGTLVVQTATQDEGFKSYEIDALDMAAGEEHRLTIALDRVDDHLQVLLDGKIVLEDTSTDFINRSDKYNWGWTLGNVWHDSFDGTIEAFSITGQAHFQLPIELDAPII